MKVTSLFRVYDLPELQSKALELPYKGNKVIEPWRISKKFKSLAYFNLLGNLLLFFPGSLRFAENVSAKKMLMVQFADDKLPTHNLPKDTTFFGKFSIFYTVKKCPMTMCRMTICQNIVLTTCNDRQYWSKWTSEGWRPKGEPSDSPAERPALSAIFFLCDLPNSANHESVNYLSVKHTLANCYPPLFPTK